MTVNPSELSFQGGVPSSRFPSLAAADSAATLLGGILYIDANWTLTGNTTLSSPTVYAAGGVISMNGFNLTINGQVDGPPIQVINVGSFNSAALSILSGTLIKGQWLTGVYGQNIDYSPGIQQGINIVMRTSSSFAGPRILDLSSGSVSSTPSGIQIQHSISFPTGAAPGGGCIWAHGQVFDVNISGANSPVFIVGSAILWSFKADAWAKFQWDPGNLPTSSNNNAIVFQFTQGSTGNGSSQFTIDGVYVYQGYGFANTSGSGYSGWWACNILNIECNSCVGQLAYHNPAAGGSERQYYRNINFINNATGGSIPAMYIQNAQCEIDNISIDAYGNGAQGVATNAALHFLGCQVILSAVHFENCKWGGGSQAQAVLFDGNTVPGNYNTFGTVNQFTMVGDISVAASTTFYAIYAFQGAMVSVDNISIGKLSLGGGATQAAFGTDANSFISVGRNMNVAAGVVGWIPQSTTVNTSLPSTIVQSGERDILYYANTIATSSAEADMSASGSSINGVYADRNYFYQGVGFVVSSALSSGSLTLKTYSGGNLLDTRVITSASGTNGILEFRSGLYQTAFQYTLGSPIRLTVTSTGLANTVNLQSTLRIV